jgi:hypothetical protein
VTKECPVCGVLFEGAVNRRYCSKQHQLNCNLCGESFDLSYHKMRTGDKTCSPCRIKAGNRQQSIKMQEKFATGQLLGYRNPTLQEKALATVRSRYGVSNISQVPEIKKKIRATLQLKYGTDSVWGAQEIKEKIRVTNLERYGAENVFASPIIKERIRETNLQRYGVKNVSQNREIRQKQLNTTFQHFGVQYPLQNRDVLAKHNATVLHRHGVTNVARMERVRVKNCQRLVRVSDQELRKYILDAAIGLQSSKLTLTSINDHFGYVSRSSMGRRIRELNLQKYIKYYVSTANQKWKEILETKFSIEFEREGKIFTNPRSRCDLYYLPEKIAIDINPTISHSMDNCHPLFVPKHRLYHQHRAIDALKNGWSFWQIYDWMPCGEMIQSIGDILSHKRPLLSHRNDVIVSLDGGTVRSYLDRGLRPTCITEPQVFASKPDSLQCYQIASSQFWTEEEAVSLLPGFHRVSNSGSIKLSN